LAPGFALSQATHFVASALFRTEQVSQSQLPSGFLNLSQSRNSPEGAENVNALLLVTGVRPSTRKTRQLTILFEHQL